MDSTDPDALANRGRDALETYELVGRRDMLDQSITLLRAALAATTPDDPDYAAHLGNLGCALLTLFECAGQPEVLDETLKVARAALAAASEDSPDYAGHLNNLANTLRAKYEQTGSLSVLVEAVELFRASVAATPEGDADLAGRLSNLGTVAMMLSDRTGQLEPLEEAVRRSRDAVVAMPEGHRERPAVLNNLGLTVRTLFERTERRGLLEEAVRFARDAVAATPEGDPARAGRMSNLGSALVMLFERTERAEDLAEAVTMMRDAVAATAGEHPMRAVLVSNLGLALWKLFNAAKQQEYLDEAVAVARDAVAATPEDHPKHAAHLYNLGLVLSASFERSGRLDVLEEAVLVVRAAAAALPANHPYRAEVLNHLGDVLRAQYEHSPRRQLLDEARAAYRAAAENVQGSTIHRIDAYRELARLAVGPQDAEDALRYVEAAIELVEVLAPGSLTRGDREHQLGRLSSLPGEAAAVALNAGRPDRAVELLERTRGILAADALGLRGGERARLLRAHAPELADRLEGLRARLEALDEARPASMRAAASATGLDTPSAEQYLAAGRTAAHAAWQALLAQIRALPDFADFLRPLPAATLARHATRGPVVYVTVGATRADALILTADTPDPVHVVPLTGLTRDAAFDQVGKLLTAQYAAGNRDLDAETRQGGRDEILTILDWLWDTVAAPVLKHLGYTETSAGTQRRPRIWWCPVGVLTFLPLHAAGRVPDLVVSSYTPTARALAPGRTSEADDDANAPAVPAALVVPVADIPGAGLPGVTVETSAITTLISAAEILHRPTRDGVLHALPRYRIAHFACHGHADMADPARSQLILADHATNPLTLADIMPLRLDADLAYLSACNTAVTAPRLADESLHITGAFHLAGYHHVIGTLWPIDDTSAAEIAEDFYAYLTTDGIAHPDRAADALHYATTRLRARHPGNPALWAAHTHTGA